MILINLLLFILRAESRRIFFLLGSRLRSNHKSSFSVIFDKIDKNSYAPTATIKLKGKYTGIKCQSSVSFEVKKGYKIMKFQRKIKNIFFLRNLKVTSKNAKEAIQM